MPNASMSSSAGEPVFIRKPDDQIGISGGVASFVCQATGDPKPRITWMKKGKKVSSQRFEVGANAGNKGQRPPSPQSSPSVCQAGMRRS